MDNHYIILRKDKATKQVEYLRVLDCKRHDWTSKRNKSTIFNNANMQKKVRDLSKHGKKNCLYFPQYVYQQGTLFKDNEL